MAISVQCPTRRYIVILFQDVTLNCNYQTTATQSPVVTWKYKSYCRDPIQAAFSPSSAESILSQNNPNYDPNIECADSQRTVRIVASKQNAAVTLGADYQGRKISVQNNADLNIAQTAWGDSGVYVCSVVSAQDLSGNGEEFTELIVLEKSNTTDLLPGIDLLVMEVLSAHLLLLHQLPLLPRALLLPTGLVRGRKSSEERWNSHESVCSHPLCSQYVRPARIRSAWYAYTSYTQRSRYPPPHNGYGREYDAASSVGQGSQVPLLHGQDGGVDNTRSGYRIQVDPDGNATRAIYYMEKELANMDPSRPGNYNRSRPAPRQLPASRWRVHGGPCVRARSMDNLDDIGRRNGRDDHPPRRPDEIRGRRGSDDGWSSSARSGNNRDIDDRRRRDYSPEDRGRGEGGGYGGLPGRRSRSRDDLMALERDRRPEGNARGRRDDYDDNFLREALERKKMGEQQRARSREHLDSESDRSDRAGCRAGPPHSPRSRPPDTTDAVMITHRLHRHRTVTMKVCHPQRKATSARMEL
ncbi:hypothetical protein F7725_018205 [Dissostichus mawsoni]|uniref:Ig-like domain-containing protein n=1 Tax=Dissostichus mawsoni TaxID=36200 RepID=A0A7J5XTQ8_DISMA|nr:hypothetical protein F7725_018205 [Dissostichus mawsoni]